MNAPLRVLAAVCALGASACARTTASTPCGMVDFSTFLRHGKATVVCGIAHAVPIESEEIRLVQLQGEPPTRIVGSIEIEHAPISEGLAGAIGTLLGFAAGLIP